jgi:hypothetical protein
MLGSHAAEQIGAQGAGDLDEDDDIVIALGSTLLWVTGQIDTEGPAGFVMLYVVARPTYVRW